MDKITITAEDANDILEQLAHYRLLLEANVGIVPPSLNEIIDNLKNKIEEA